MSGRLPPTLLVLARYPALGQVKTRLAGRIGAEAALALYRAFVVDLAGRLRRLPYESAWAYWPPDVPFAALIAGAVCFPQYGGDLGERLRHAIASRLAATGAAVIAIGADVPHVPQAALAEAARALDSGCDLVLGPARDGGYFLIGVRRDWPDLFVGVPWGTADVLAATVKRARQLELRMRFLPPSFDLDDVEDLSDLATLLATGDADLPRTAEVLAALGLLPARD